MGIELKNVSFEYRFPHKEVLEDVSLKIGTGEVVALMGTSGCGKTTLLKIISSLLNPTKGTVEIFNEEGRVVEKKHVLNNIAYVTQEADKMVYPWLTVEQNLYYPNRLRKKWNKTSATYCDSILERLKISDKRNNYPTKLSGGERKRLSIAMALSYKPSVILMDEPLTGLDFKLTQELWDFLFSDFKERNPTVLFVTHSLDEASILADRVIYFKEMFKSIYLPDKAFEDYEKTDVTPRHTLLKHPKIIEYRQYLLEQFNAAMND